MSKGDPRTLIGTLILNRKSRKWILRKVDIEDIKTLQSDYLNFYSVGNEIC